MKQHIHKIGFGLAILLSLGLLLWMRELASWRPQVMSIAKRGSGSEYLADVSSHVQFSPDGRLMFLLQLKAHKVYICDVKQRRALFEVPIFRGPRMVFSPEVVFSPDGRQILLSENWTGQSATRRYLLLSTRDGKLVRDGRMPRFLPGIAPFWFLFSPDSKEVWGVGGQAIQRTDARTGRYLGLRSYTSGAKSLKFSPNGKLVMVDCGGDYRLYNSTSAKLLHVFKSERPYSGADGWSEESSIFWMDVGKTNPEVQFRHVPDCQVIGHVKMVNLKASVYFLPNSKTLAIATDKGLVLRDIATGQTIKTLPGPLAEPFTMSPDGSFAVSVDKNGRLWRWRLK